MGAQTSSCHILGSSFALQYTSLILIILAFVIGAFNSPRLAANQVPSPTAQIESEPIGEMKFNDLFEPNSDAINETRLVALSEFLKAHDVNAKIEIFQPHSSASDPQAFDRAVARSVSLFRSFVQMGVPAEALAVIAVPQVSEEQTAVHFSWSSERREDT